MKNADAGNIEHTKSSNDKVDNPAVKTDNANVKVDNQLCKVDNVDMKDLCRGVVQEPGCTEMLREMKDVSEKGAGIESNEIESRKRSSSELDTETESKRAKHNPIAMASEMKGTDESESNGITASMDETGKKIDVTSNIMLRKDVIQRFWNEQKANSQKQNKKKAEKSFYETQEPFKDDEECLLLSKMVLRKEDGVISFSLTHMAGTREAMHQIMQFFRNKLSVKPNKT